MRLLKKFTVVAMALTALALMPKRANAALLTLNDGPDVWTLSVQENCTSCAITLSVTYSASSPRIGTDLGAVQWDLTDPNVNPTVIGFTSTTGTGNNFADWTFSFANVNNTGGSAGCDGGDPNAVCGVHVGAASGGGLTVAAGTYSWIFQSTFASLLTNLNTGNIRAAYDVSAGGLDTIFSPGGGTFGGGGGTTGGGGGTSGGGGATVPEPASMLLFGAGALAAAYRARRRTVR